MYGSFIESLLLVAIPAKVGGLEGRTKIFGEELSGI
jgi:hypothetical protein